MTITTDSELLEMMVEDRIEFLLQKIKKKGQKKSDKDRLIKAEAIIDKLPKLDKELVYYYIDDIMTLMSMEETYLYKAGFIDGTKVTNKLNKL